MFHYPLWKRVRTVNGTPTDAFLNTVFTYGSFYVSFVAVFTFPRFHVSFTLNGGVPVQPVIPVPCNCCIPPVLFLPLCCFYVSVNLSAGRTTNIAVSIGRGKTPTLQPPYCGLSFDPRPLGCVSVDCSCSPSRSFSVSLCSRFKSYISKVSRQSLGSTK